MITAEELGTDIKKSVDWLIEQDCGCCTIELDDVLAVCVGWSNGYDRSDETVIHSKSDEEYAIVAGIKCWTTDDMRTDFDYIGYPFDDDGCFDYDCAVSPNSTIEDYVSTAKRMLESYNELLMYDIDGSGRATRKEEDETIKQVA